MTSFSHSVKCAVAAKTLEEIGVCQRDHEKISPCCAAAFLTAAFLYGAAPEGDRFVLSSRVMDFSECCAHLLIRHYGIEVDVKAVERKEGTAFTIAVPQKECLAVFKPVEALLACPHCPSYYLRAAFLSCGTVLDPEKGNHASFSVKLKADAETLVNVLFDLGIEAKIAPGGKGYSVYIKRGDRIEDLMSAIGAQHFALQMMSRHVESNIRSNVNRKQNFDSANIQKIVNKAQEEIAAIRYLEERGVLHALPEPLVKAARLRLENPSASLMDLCFLSPEKITKSGLYHRLGRIVEIAREREKSEKKKGYSHEEE